MTPPVIEARRFLHCCYCCAEVNSAIAMFEQVFGLGVGMRTSGHPADGSILGFPGDVHSPTAFVYDRRGPAVGPAIEVQAWLDPPAAGRPYPEPHHVGIQAIGIAVPDLAGILRSGRKAGLRVEAPPQLNPAFGAVAAVVRDEMGVRFDLVETACVDPQLRHLRVSCRDIDRSVAWYEGIGFLVLGREDVELPEGALGHKGPASLAGARLGLPDEATILLLQEWRRPGPVGGPYPVPNHRGLYRAAVGVEDTRAAARRLASAGWVVTRGPQIVVLEGTKVPDLWIAFIEDPDGIPIELVERARDAFR